MQSGLVAPSLLGQTGLGLINYGMLNPPGSSSREEAPMDTKNLKSLFEMLKLLGKGQ